MSKFSHSEIIHILDNISGKGSSQVLPGGQTGEQRGREVDFNDLTFMKVFILMFFVQINTIKGIWKYLSQNEEISKACGFSRLPDRSTLSRRLRRLNIADWI